METVQTEVNSNILEYVKKYSLQLLEPFIQSTDRDMYSSVNPANKIPISADWPDLIFLHRLIIERKVTTILEFGVGKSTKIMAHALLQNKNKYFDFVTNNLRRKNAFELHSVDALSEYIELTKNSTPKDLINLIHFHHSRVRMAEFSHRICSLYDKLPNITPDFIYLDGPDLYSVEGEIRNISTAHADRLPMAADILTIEHFLLPGTLIVVDGRTANARFLYCNFQRDWRYQHLVDQDLHVFELCETPLGQYNRKQIIFSLGEEWLAKVSG